MRNGKIREKKTCFDAGKIRFCQCAAILQTQVPKLCTDLDVSLLYILILGTYGKFARENNFLALGVFFPQPCSSAGCRFAASGHVYKTADESFRFHNKNFDEVHRNWIPLRIRVRLKNTQPHLKVLRKYIKVGLGISRTNKESQWKSFYKSFHQILCGNK